MDPSLQRIIIITAPSGAGKTTITRFLLSTYPDTLSFSVSATTRPPRGEERDGVEYRFMDAAAFRQKVEAGAFLEWEMVYEGRYYGTLQSEVGRIWAQGRTPLLDIDVKGAMRVMEVHKGPLLSLFIAPPSMQALEERLRRRGTETEEAIRTRLAKSGYEMGFRDRFGHVVVNDDLDRACREVADIVSGFLQA